MQGTTRSVEAVEGVVVEAAKAMASGGTVSPSASAGGFKSSVVLNHGGGGRYNKRKGLPGGGGGHSSPITIGKKKLCSSSSTNEIAQPAATAADTAVAVTILKKKERAMDDEIVGDLSLEDAARALADFSWFAHKPVARSSPHGSHKSLPPALPQWKITKVRSGRTRRMESSSNEDSSHLAITTTDSSNPSPLLLQKQQQQVSECSSSPGGDSQSVITLVKVEDGPFCSSMGVEEEEQVEQHKVVEVVVEEGQDENNNDNRSFPSDSDRLVLHKLTSVSSIESILPDSRAESPSSPLPPVLRTGEFASLCGVVPKFEGSAFRRVVPIRPVKKPTSCRKLKVEEKTFEDLNPEQAAVKHVSRKKPRPTGFVPQQQQQVYHQLQQQLAPVKIEETDAFCALALGPPRLSATEEEEVKKVGVLSRIAPPSAAAVAAEEKPVKFDSVVIKLETKPSGKLGRTTSKAKPALSESEKEARKQRRVQANRESARLTIRKKQVLCEELSRKAQFLSTENEQFRKEVERMLQEKKNISEMNSKLKEEVAKAAGKHEPGSSSPAPPSMGKPPDGMVQYQFPHPFGGLPMVPPYMWAFAMAQAQAAAQVAAIQPSEINIGSAEFTAFFAAAAAAAAACGTNSQAAFWNMASCSSSQGQSSMLPPFLPGHLPGALVASALPPSCDTPATISPIMRSISLPVGPTDASFSLVASERSLPSGKPVASYRSGDFADSVHFSHDLKRNATQQDSTHQGSGFSGRTHYFQMTPGSQTGMATTGVGTIATRKSGEGNGLSMSNAAGQPLSRSHSLSTPHMPKLHSRYSMFGSGGISATQERPTARESEAQRVHAAAAEARRKRIELKRTKSILNRQVARVAEPSA